MYHHPSQLRIANVRRAFRTLLAKGPCSRAELARTIGLSAVTAGKVVDGMLADGLVLEVEERAAAVGEPAAMGRPPRMVGLSPAVRMLAVEIGAVESSVRALSLADAARADLDEPLNGDRAPVRFATPSGQARFVAELERAASTIGLDRPAAVLVSVPGVLGADGTEIVFSPNLRWTGGRELLPRIAERLDAPLCAVQEIQALALGHLAVEAVDSFVLVDFGDGVGGAVVTGGQLLHGPQPLCGEIGHTAVFGNRRRCGCGAVGCLETLVSRGGVLQSFRSARRRPRATWQECMRHVAARGVEAWLAPSIDAAATVIAGALNLVGATELVLTGDLPALHPDLVDALERRVQEHALVGRFARLGVRLAPRRRMLGLVAAAADRLLLPEPAMPAARPA